MRTQEALEAVFEFLPLGRRHLVALCGEAKVLVEPREERLEGGHVRLPAPAHLEEQAMPIVAL